MRVLILYCSRYGQTQRICERIASIVRAAGADTEIHPLDAVPHALFAPPPDFVVVAAPIYFGRHPRALARFLAAQRPELAKARTLFVSVSGAARSPEGRVIAEQCAKELFAAAGWSADSVVCFAGGEPYASRYGWFVRWFMKRHHRKLGIEVDPTRDHDFTDWTAVERVAKDVAASTSTA